MIEFQDHRIAETPEEVRALVAYLIDHPEQLAGIVRTIPRLTAAWRVVQANYQQGLTPAQALEVRNDFGHAMTNLLNLEDLRASTEAPASN